MKRGTSVYQRLPGRGHDLASSTRLYLAADHLLQVSSAGFSERYKRFYFRDLQAFVVIRTQTWLWIMAAWAAVALLAILIAIATRDRVASIVCSVVAGAGLALVISGYVRGPSCRCHVQTAIQMEKILSLNRVKRTDTVLAMLKPLIESAQAGAGQSQVEDGGAGPPPDEAPAAPGEPPAAAGENLSLS